MSHFPITSASAFFPHIADPSQTNFHMNAYNQKYPLIWGVEEFDKVHRPQQNMLNKPSELPPATPDTNL